MPSSPDPTADENGVRWAEILREFETQLARVDLLAAELVEAGVVFTAEELAGQTLPDDLGPLPDSERHRALAILKAQRAAMAQLERLRVDLARHIAMTSAPTSRIPDSVYLDRTA